MAEIAYTAFGRNALLSGLICHVVAIVVSIMTAFGLPLYFSIVFPLSCLLLIAGVWAELRYRGYRSLTGWRFYLMAAVTVLPVIGVLLLLLLLYRYQKKEREERDCLSGLLPAIFRLKANSMGILALILFLFILFVVINAQDDPYFKRRTNRGNVTATGILH
ncbi:MAG TPA: hypothetical protein PKZ12_05730 [Smithellaceae bacterium]|nr:hypothetical protein [Smithellaceae bacterium]